MCFSVDLDVLTLFIHVAICLCIVFNFVGVVSTWLVESYHKSGQLKHQSMPGASSEGKQATHGCYCVLNNLLSIRRLLSECYNPTDQVSHWLFSVEAILIKQLRL